MWKIQDLSEPSQAHQEAQWPEGSVPRKCYGSRFSVMRKEKEVKQASIRSITRDRKTSHWVPASRAVYYGKRRARLHCAFTPTDHLPECS